MQVGWLADWLVGGPVERAGALRGSRRILGTMIWMAEQEAGKLAQMQAAAEAVPEAWRKTELARHPERPYPMDFIEALFTDFSEIRVID
jgi:hypothetical protein